MGTIELAVVGIAGSGIGTALAAPMVWPGPARPLEVRLLGAWLLATAAIVGLISLRVIGAVPASSAVEHSINLLGLGAYPLLYLYIREQVEPRAEAIRVRWLWGPAIVYAVTLTARGLSGSTTRVPFLWMLPVLLAFTVMCAVEALRTRTGQRTPLVPARWIVVFLVLLNIAQTIRMLFGHVPPVPALVPLVMTCGLVAMVGLVAWRALDSPPKVQTREEPVRPRYERSGLDEVAALALLARMDEALTRDRLFADQGLTLARLAAAVDASPHQVSEVLNRHAGVSFHERLNRLRVADVKAQLLDPAADRFTIEGIGGAAGFGSRSALYAAFRRIEGLTPTEFRARRRPAERG
jgi:AraC-like DNA-binding protein